MIYLLCSTIRPKVFETTHADWVEKSDSRDNFTTKVIVDNVVDSKQLKDFDVQIFQGQGIGITKPLYQLVKSLPEIKDDDIVVVVSDDFFPPEHWDTFLIDQYKDFTGGLSVYDGGSVANQQSIITIPILDGATMRKLNNLIYHPVYTHLYSDNELYDNLKEMGLLKIIDSKLGYTFEHRHWTKSKRKKDAQDIKITKKALADKTTFFTRRGLPLTKKLEYQPDNSPVLSILICTMPKRKKMLDRLILRLKPQLSSDVEILVHSDEGELNIGAKRNELLNKATGKYVAFVDDDDLVSDDYVELILKAAKNGTDSIGIEGTMTTNGKNPRTFKHSIRYNKWETVNSVFLRHPNHINPILRSIAMMTMFNAKLSFGEDKDFSDRVKPLLRAEAYIHKPIYEYLYTTGKKDY